MNPPRVSILILNWNSWRDTVECLNALYKVNYSNYDVIVIDNNSTDDSLHKLIEYTSRQHHRKYVFIINEKDAKKGHFNKQFYEKIDANRRLIIIRNFKNYGFAGGNNIGIKFAMTVLNPEYILLLNPDTVPTRDFLINLVTCAHSSSTLVNPNIRNYSININENRSSHQNSVKMKRKKIASGAALLIPTSIIIKSGLLNENFYPAYGEDFEFSARIHEHTGLYPIECLNSIVYHKSGQSTKKLKHFKYYLQAKFQVYNLISTPVMFKVDALKSLVEIGFWAILSAIRFKTNKFLISYLKGILEGLITYRKWRSPYNMY